MRTLLKGKYHIFKFLEAKLKLFAGLSAEILQLISKNSKDVKFLLD